MLELEPWHITVAPSTERAAMEGRLNGLTAGYSGYDGELKNDSYLCHLTSNTIGTSVEEPNISTYL